MTAWAGFGPDWSEHGCELTKKTGHRIKYLKVDADTGEEVSSDEIIKGYKVDTDSKPPLLHGAPGDAGDEAIEK